MAAVNANTARFNAHAAALAGQEVKARLYAEQVRAFGAEVDAAKVAAETSWPFRPGTTKCALTLQGRRDPVRAAVNAVQLCVL